MSEKQKYEFVYALVAGFSIKDSAEWAEINIKDAKNFMRRIEFKEFLRLETSNVYGAYSLIPERWRNKL